MMAPNKTDIPFLREKDGSIYLSVHVATGAGKDSFCGVHAGCLKIKLRARPVRGEANRNLIEFLSGAFKTNKSSIEIIKGETSKKKLLKLTTVEKKDVISALDSAL